MKRNILSLLALILICTATAIAQTGDADALVKYRVTAYKKGDNTVKSLSNTVETTAPFNLYIPNAFTPNGDGLNDVFGAAGEGISEFTMQVFNRWGNLVFETNDMRRQWDGTYKGEKAELGVYVYQVMAKGPKSYMIKRQGSVTLVQ